MSFLTPFFLLASAAIAIPIFVHLIQRERKQVVEFPSLMFLEKIPYQSVRRRRIRDWPLLAMRLAAILLIVLAFARPFFDRPISAGFFVQSGSCTPPGLKVRPLPPSTSTENPPKITARAWPSDAGALLLLDAARQTYELIGCNSHLG